MFDTVLLTTNVGSITAILQLFLLNPSKAFKPLTHPGFLGTVAHTSQLVWESDAWVVLSHLHNSERGSAAEWGKQHCCRSLRPVTRASCPALGKSV